MSGDRQGDDDSQGETANVCTGAWDCEASPHVHGCHADYGDCDERGEHIKAFDAMFSDGKNGSPEKP